MDQQFVASDAQSGSGQSEESWHAGLDSEDERALDQAREDSSAIVEEIPTEEKSLGWFSVISLLLNRMIGQCYSQPRPRRAPGFLALLFLHL